MPREDLDNLLSACIPFAQQVLAKNGTFFPFGATMSPTGEISLAAGYDDQPGAGAQEVADLTLDGFAPALARATTKPLPCVLTLALMLPMVQAKPTRSA